MEFLLTYQEDMISYVASLLDQHDTAGNPRKSKIGYRRFEHSMRVYKWAKTLYEAYSNKENVDFEALAIACIFHDVGYLDPEQRKMHAQISASYCREYLCEKNYPAEKTDFVCDIISRHSDKETIHDDIPEELVLLMEADLLDDIGAQGLVMDVWLEATCEENVTFESILAHMERYTLKDMQGNPMHTAEGRRIWEEKRALTKHFVEAYREDIRM